MRMEIARTMYYDIDVDEEINRVYIDFKGDWMKVSDVPNYIMDIELALRHMRPGFTSLSDMVRMKPSSEECYRLITKSAKMLVDAGMRKQALIVDPETMDIIRNIRNTRAEVDTDEKLTRFVEHDEAHNWLEL